jgi:hypothetical protein
MCGRLGGQFVCFHEMGIHIDGHGGFEPGKYERMRLDDEDAMRFPLLVHEPEHRTDEQFALSRDNGDNHSAIEGSTRTKGGHMPLIRDRLEPGATKYFTQAGHRQTAIEQAVHYVREGFANANDLLATALSPTVCEWVIETIYQGAYYHIWEKDCKEYFNAMGVQTGKQPKQRKQSQRRTFSRYVTRVLSSEGIVVPKDVMDALSTMEE